MFLGQAIAEHMRRFVRDGTSGPLFQARDSQRVSAGTSTGGSGSGSRRRGSTAALSPHSMRHAFATGVYQRTKDILVVKEALHHRSIGSAMVYARATADQVRAALS